MTILIIIRVAYREREREKEKNVIKNWYIKMTYFKAAGEYEFVIRALKIKDGTIFYPPLFVVVVVFTFSNF